MNEADVRKLRELMKTYKVNYSFPCGIYPIQQLHRNNSLSAGGINVPMVDMDPENILVTIPLSQIKKGLQPQ